MKYLLIAFFVFTTFFSCKKDNDNEPFLGLRLVEQRTGDEYVKLQYDGNGKIIKAIMLDEDLTNGEVVTYLIAYNGAGRISEVTNSNGETVRPEYENNRLVKAVVFVGNQEIGQTDYHYENGLLKEAEIKFKLFGQESTTMKFSFTYDAQLRVKQSDLWMLNPFTDELESAGYTVMEYDTKNNPLIEFSDFLLLMWDVPAANNVVKETQYFADDTVDEVRDYIFSYNALGYPVQAIMRTTSNGVQQDINLKYTYK
jgi:YD repeat-containing protein